MEKSVEELRKELKPNDIEELIATMAQNIYTMYKSAHPNGDYLSIVFVNNGLVVTNEYWDKDKDFPMNNHHDLHV